MGHGKVSVGTVFFGVHMRGLVSLWCVCVCVCVSRCVTLHVVFPAVSDAEEDLDRASFHSLQSRSHSRSHSKSSATASLGEQVRCTDRAWDTIEEKERQAAVWAEVCVHLWVEKDILTSPMEGFVPFLAFLQLHSKSTICVTRTTRLSSSVVCFWSFTKTVSSTIERRLVLTPHPQEQEYQRRAREVWDATWGMLHEADGWRPEAGSDLVRGAVHSRAFPGIGKVYRLQVRRRHPGANRSCDRLGK